jgi:hypothetical protein
MHNHQLVGLLNLSNRPIHRALYRLLPIILPFRPIRHWSLDNAMSSAFHLGDVRLNAVFLQFVEE